MNTLKPIRQSVWRLPAVLNFTLGGIGAGLFVAGTLYSSTYLVDETVKLLYKICSPLFVGLGLVFVAAEAGKPSRARHLLKNIRRSWMSRETLAAGILIIVCFLDLLIGSSILTGIGTVVAVFLLISHGMIIYNAVGLPAWNISLVVPLFFVSGLVSGNAMFLIITSILQPSVNQLLIPTLVLIVTSMTLWFGYLYYPKDPEFVFATEKLRERSSLTVIAGIGHFVPFILLVISYIYGRNLVAENVFVTWLISFTGLMVLAGAYTIRHAVIIRVGFFRRVSLHKKETVGQEMDVAVKEYPKC